jgi:acyl carrier protein
VRSEFPSWGNRHIVASSRTQKHGQTSCPWHPALPVAGALRGKTWSELWKFTNWRLNPSVEDLMDHKEVEKRVVKVVCQVLGAEPEMVKPESHFVYDLGAESTQSIELVAGFEHEFNIEMDEDSALEVQTVGDAVEFIAKCL